MRAKKVWETLNEGYGVGYGGYSGAGYSFTGGTRGMLGGTRGGFGGANNLGGPNMMYTYEIKPLNHTLEQNYQSDTPQIQEIGVGSKVIGTPVRSNASPDKDRKVTGIVHKIVKSDLDAIKYYVVFDEATQTLKKLEPLSTEIIIEEPIKYYFDATDVVPSKRRGEKQLPPSVQRP